VARIKAEEATEEEHKQSGGQDRAHALGWGEGVHPNRPETIARYHTIPHKVTDVSNYDYLKVRGPGEVSLWSPGP
jgi:hypothetical protein